MLVVGRFHLESAAHHLAQTLEAGGTPALRVEATTPQKAGAGPLRRRVESLRRHLETIAEAAPGGRERLNRRLLDAARGRRVEFTLVCHDALQPDEVARLRDVTGAPVVVWFPDAISNFRKAWLLNAPYDAVFFKDPYVVAMLRRTLERPVLYLPEAFNPALHRAEPLGEEDERRYGCDVTTAGNVYTYRVAFFEGLRDYHVRIWGNPPPEWMDVSGIEPMLERRFLIHDEKARAFRAARAVVNNLHPAEIWGLNARAFEVAGCGAFQLVDWRPGLAQLFEDGREIVSFHSLADLRAKLDHYLAAPEEREAIARAGHERALRDHTFARRIERIRDTLAGRAEGHPLPQLAWPGDET